MTTSKPDRRNEPITVGAETVPPGRIRRFELPVARLPTGSVLSMPVAVINGRYAGPHVWLSAAIHGDELNGVAVVRRLIRTLDPKRLGGAVVAVPVVNVFGFVNRSRYLPDGRDLNRSFPGSSRGSLAARMARLFLAEVVRHCSVGIDLHTAAGHRVNLPQIRGDMDDDETQALAAAFGAPFMIHARVRDGSLRQAATEMGSRVLLYEAGQAQRFDEDSISLGVNGVLRTLTALGMGEWEAPRVRRRPQLVRRTTWVRARRSGIVDVLVALGERVAHGQPVAAIGDAFGNRPTTMRAPGDGWVIARTLNPLVSQGDALVHVATDVGVSRDEPAVRRRRGSSPG